MGILTRGEQFKECYGTILIVSYSFRSCLEARDAKSIAAADALYLEWNGLCKLKRTWDSFSSLTRDRNPEEIETMFRRDPSIKTWDPKFLRVLLVQMKLILFRVGLEDDKGIY